MVLLHNRKIPYYPEKDGCQVRSSSKNSMCPSLLEDSINGI